MHSLLECLKIRFVVDAEMLASNLLGLLLDVLGSELGEVSGVLENSDESILMECFIVVFLNVT